MSNALNDLNMDFSLKELMRDYAAEHARGILYATASTVLIYLIALAS